MPTNVNDPNTKYAHNSEPKAASAKDKLLFFNYHEFLASDPKSSHSVSTDASLVVNHFPNNYENQDSLSHSSTRIVRVPRVYDTIRYSDLIPQFSTHVPGKEPAALTSSGSGTDGRYQPVGVFDDNGFGHTSLTPLVPELLSEEEFTEIVTGINKRLFEALNPNGYRNLADSVMDVMSGGTISLVVDPNSKTKLLDLEAYIEEVVNLRLSEKAKGFRIISLRQSGYLSLDFQIPRPQH